MDIAKLHDVAEIDAMSSPCKAVIKRHQTLINTRDDILDNISTATDEVYCYPCHGIHS